MTANERAYLKRLSERERQRAKRGWKKRHADMANQEPDADTLRWRALQDRKGELCATFTVLRGDTYTVRHSRRRTDAYDVTGGGCRFTGGGHAVGRMLADMLP